jgi:histidine triad (HIT) family protein
MANPKDCIFCKIINGEIPSDIVYEDDNSMAVLDISPIAEGHTIVILKRHYKNLLDAPDEAAAAMMRVCRRIGMAVKSALAADGFNVFCNNERCAGQAVDHIHMHVVPRKNDDGLRLDRPQGRYPKGRAAEIREKLRKQMDATN